MALLTTFLVTLLGIAGIAADFHRIHARTIPTSPPPYIGPHLYVTWNVPEPDRIGALWLLRRFSDPQAQFYLVEPMSQITFGTPFDIPEAEIRRGQNTSVFQDLLARLPVRDDPALKRLAAMCYAIEIRPWAVDASDETQKLISELRSQIGACQQLDGCLEAGLSWFEETYMKLDRETASGKVE